MAWTPDDVQNIGERHRRYLEDTFARWQRAKKDTEQKSRQYQRECCWCFYRGGLTGAAFTEWSCRSCEKPQVMHPNTAVPALCNVCADYLSACVHCGGAREWA